MSSIRGELHRRIHKYYKEALEDDVDEGIAAANLALWEATRKGVVIENQRAFSICVAKRYVAGIMQYRTKHLHPEQSEGQPVQGTEVWQDMVSVQSNEYARLDVATILAESPASYAEVLRKHYLEGETLEEIARETGNTSACIRKRHERALKWARKHFPSE